MKAPQQIRLWSVPLRLDEVPETGQHIAIEAPEPVRAAVAKAAGVLEVLQFGAVFDVVRRGRDRLRVTGEVTATVRQACVVTLEPVQNRVEEAVDLEFVAAAAGSADVAAAGPAGVDPDRDPPEVLADGSVDLGTIATEFLFLGLDPYPRAPGAVFEPVAPRGDADSPFAALAALKPKNERGR